MERQSLLSTYQSTTGQKDRSVAIRNLELHNWNLEAAVTAAGGARNPDGQAQNVSTAGSRLSLRAVLGYIASFLPTGPLEENNGATAVRLYQLEYEERFSLAHPNFFEGTFRDALTKARNEYKFLLVYLHSDQHVRTPAFCRDVLAQRRVIDFLNENFVVWSISVSYPAGHEMSSVLGACTYPFIAVLNSAQTSPLQLLYLMDEPVSADTLLEQLGILIAEGGHILAAARARAETQQRNRELLEQQNADYQASLLADQERERNEEAERARIAAEEARVRDEALRAEQEVARKRAEEQAIANRRAAELDRKRRELPSEPTTTDSPVSTIVVRLPDGTRLTRKFLLTDSVKAIYDWVDLNQSQLALDSYWLAQNYPRQTFSNLAQTIEAAKLFPQGTLFVQDKEKQQ